MLRASYHGPAFFLPPSLLSFRGLRTLPLLSSVPSACFEAVCASPFSLLPPLPRGPPRDPIPRHSSFAYHPLTRLAASVVVRMPTRRRFGGIVCFSSGSNEEGVGKERLIQHLLVGEGDLKLLVELHKKTSEGVDLSDLAVEYSICPSKQNGGMLGWMRRGQMVREFEEAAFSAPVNSVVRCKTKFGWHLLQVLSEREGSLLEDIGPEVLHSKMQDSQFTEEAQLIDVREPDEVAKASLPGFKVLPLRQFGKWGTEIMNDFDPEKDTYVLGFKRIFNVAGGIHAYALKADPSIPTY